MLKNDEDADLQTMVPSLRIQEPSINIGRSGRKRTSLGRAESSATLRDLSRLSARSIPRLRDTSVSMAHSDFTVTSDDDDSDFSIDGGAASNIPSPSARRHTNAATSNLQQTPKQRHGSIGPAAPPAAAAAAGHLSNANLARLNNNSTGAKAAAASSKHRPVSDDDDDDDCEFVLLTPVPPPLAPPPALPAFRRPQASEAPSGAAGSGLRRRNPSRNGTPPLTPTVGPAPTTPPPQPQSAFARRPISNGTAAPQSLNASSTLPPLPPTPLSSRPGSGSAPRGGGRPPRLTTATNGGAGALSAMDADDVELDDEDPITIGATTLPPVSDIAPSSSSSGAAAASRPALPTAAKQAAAGLPPLVPPPGFAGPSPRGAAASVVPQPPPPSLASSGNGGGGVGGMRPPSVLSASGSGNPATRRLYSADSNATAAHAIRGGAGSRTESIGSSFDTTPSTVNVTVAAAAPPSGPTSPITAPSAKHPAVVVSPRRARTGTMSTAVSAGGGGGGQA